MFNKRHRRAVLINIMIRMLHALHMLVITIIPAIALCACYEEMRRIEIQMRHRRWSTVDDD